MIITPTLILVGAAVIAGLVLIVGIVSVRSQKDVIEERLGALDMSATAAFVDMEGLEPDEGQAPTTFKEKLDEILTRRPVGKKWRIALSRADLKITVAEYALIHVLTTLGGFIGAYFVVWPGQLVMAVVAAFVGFFAPRFIVARMTSRRLIRFENQLPDTLSLWVNALRSGYSVMQSMETISRDAPEPTATEFKRVVQEVQLGISVPDSLAHLLVRMESEDLDLVITAVNIQLEVGGNLAEILEVIGHTIRERIKIKGEIRVLTSQGRFTGLLISGLPILLALFLNTINPSYVGLLFTNRTCGWPLLAAGLILIGIGSAVIQKIVDIEV